MDSQFFNVKAKLKDLEIELENNDNVLQCIKEAMILHNVAKANIVAVSGYIKDFKIQYLQKNSLKNLHIIDKRELVGCSGEFKCDFVNKKLYGRARINYKEKGKVFSAILMSGFASDYLKITLRFLEF